MYRLRISSRKAVHVFAWRSAFVGNSTVFREEFPMIESSWQSKPEEQIKFRDQKDKLIITNGQLCFLGNSLEMDLDPKNPRGRWKMRSQTN